MDNIQLSKGVETYLRDLSDKGVETFIKRLVSCLDLPTDHTYKLELRGKKGKFIRVYEVVDEEYLGITKRMKYPRYSVSVGGHLWNGTKFQSLDVSSFKYL